MKKLIALLLALVMVFAMTACGAQDATPATTPETQKPAQSNNTPATEANAENGLDPNEKVTLHLYGTANFIDVGPDGMIDLVSGVEMPGYNELIAKWNEKYPNVEIVVETCPWDNWITSIQTAVLSGGVDIILHGASLTELCEPLDPYLERDSDYASMLFATENKRFGDLSKTMVSGIQYVIEPSVAYIDTDILGIEIPEVLVVNVGIVSGQKFLLKHPIDHRIVPGIQAPVPAVQQCFGKAQNRRNRQGPNRPLDQHILPAKGSQLVDKLGGQPHGGVGS